MDNDQTIDQAKEIRKGEELNIESLEKFLQDSLQLSGKLEVQQFPSGHSNLTYLIKLGDKEMVLRRPPFGAEDIAKGHDMGREYKVLSKVNPVYPQAPKPLAYTDDKSVIGAPFYVMERVHGIILRAGQKLSYTPEEMRELNLNLIDNQVAIHSLDIHKTGLVELGKPEGYLERQVMGWIKRYQKSQTEEIPEMNHAMEWLPKNMPESPEPTFIHNDYKYDNVILDPNNPTQIKAVLDWEMSTVGDPFSDFGSTLAYTNEETDPGNFKHFGIQLTPGMLNRDEILARYEEKTGKKVDNVGFYYAFALFKLAVILQQIYYRFDKGYTQDQRFAPLIHILKDCATLADLTIKSGKIRDF